MNTTWTQRTPSGTSTTLDESFKITIRVVRKCGTLFGLNVVSDFDLNS